MSSIERGNTSFINRTDIFMGVDVLH